MSWNFLSKTLAENWKWFEFDLTESIDNNVIDAASLIIS